MRISLAASLILAVPVAGVAEKPWTSLGRGLEQGPTPLAGNNPKSGRLLFWNEFRDAMRNDNPSLTDDAIMEMWRTKYAGR